MFKNYLKIALRNIVRHKGYSFINIAGLAIGMTCCILIMLFVQHELSYDRFHDQADKIYRLAMDLKQKTRVVHSTKTRAWIAPRIVQDLPEVKDAVRIFKYGGCVVSRDEIQFAEVPYFVDPNIFDVFTFPFIKGNEKTALQDPNSVVITREFAQKYFGDEDPMGKVLTLNSKYDCIVRGVLKNIPYNSHFRFDLLGSIQFLKNQFGIERFSQDDYRVRTYLLLDKCDSVENLAGKIHKLIIQLKGKRYAKREYYLQPLTSIHLKSHTSVELGKNSNINYSYFLSGIALLILLIACVNFINLSTARANRRSKEVGLRKVVGADRKRLIKQFLGEAMIFSVLALLLAIVLTELFLTPFNTLVDRHLDLSFANNLPLFIGLLLLTLFVGFVAGSYPAFFLSSFTPVQVLKNQQQIKTAMGAFLRNGLVVFQFVISIVLIFGTIIILRQMTFIKNRDLGFKKDYVIFINSDKTLRKKYSVVKSELLQDPQIINVTASTIVTPGSFVGLPMSYNVKEDEKVTLYWSPVDFNFFNFFDIEIIQGRNFSEEFSADKGSALILNETAVKLLGWDEPIGERIKDTGWGVDGTVIGVVKDYHNVSLHQEIKPLVYQAGIEDVSAFFVRIQPHNVDKTIAFIKEKILKFSPNFLFWYCFLDESIDKAYNEDKNILNVFNLSSGLSIFIASLGLLGLISFSVQRRTKEFGIRKVLGASVLGIVRMLNSEFTKLIIFANIIAWPIAYYSMNKWLQNFAYRINIGWWTFLMAGGSALVIALLTVSYHAIRAAIANPVESLRYE